MCGISGILGSGWEPSQLTAMVDSLAHRGPDDRGRYVDPANGVGLGHNRLSILDLGPAGRQPMADASGRLHLVFNGEIYNYRELREELHDYPYRTRTDTEVILAAYRQWGVSCVEHFNGMFAFALWDASRRQLFAARDRLGIKPFYYCHLNGCFLFASEIKALLAAGFPARMSQEILRDYLLQGWYEHRPETFFEGIRSLQPGHTLLCRDGELHEAPYWELSRIAEETTETFDAGQETWRELLAERLDDAVRLRLRSDVPVGMHLSGGLDSSALLATLDHLLPAESRLEAFTATFGDARYDEVIHSRRVARSLDLQLHAAPFRPDELWATAERAQWHQEQPFGGVSTLGYWNLEQTARERGITVLLEGQGGDELFGGYAYYQADHVQDLLDTGRQDDIEPFLARCAERQGLSPEQLTLKVERMRRSRGKIFQDGSSFLRTDCLADDFSRLGPSSPELRLPETSAFRRARVRDLRYTKLPRVLRFNDRMSMAFGRELRVPLLDHRLVELSFQLPDDLLLHDGHTKWPLRRALEGRLDDQIRLAPKRAVVTPQKEWFRGPLRQEIAARLERSELARLGILDRQRALAAFHQFTHDPKIENAFYLWQWLNLDLWIETFRVS